LSKVLAAARQSAPSLRGVKPPTSDWSICSSPSGKDSSPVGLAISSDVDVPMAQSPRLGECIICPTWHCTVAADCSRREKTSFRWDPLRSTYKGSGPSWARTGRSFGPGRAIHSGLGQLPFHVGRMLTLKVCVTKSSMLKLLLIILLAEFKDQ
jgi:hypothetical protein